MEKEIQARRQATPQGLVGGATRVGRRLIYSRDVRDWSQAAESVVGLFYTMKRATWRSARQHVNAVRTCDTERLEQSLAEAAAAFPGCAERVLAVLIHVRAFSLADALDCMKAAGFRVGHALLTLEVFLSSSHAHDGRQSEARLTLADFELAFTFWDKLEDAVKAWLSVSFVRVWQSPAGAGLPGPLLFRLKELWQHTPPTAKQRLPPARACGLCATVMARASVARAAVTMVAGSQEGISGMAEIVTSVLEGAKRAAARAVAVGRVAGGEKCRDERW